MNLEVPKCTCNDFFQKNGWHRELCPYARSEKPVQEKGPFTLTYKPPVQEKYCRHGLRYCDCAPVPQTHEAPEKGASRELLRLPAEADTTTLPHDDWSKEWDALVNETALVKDENFVTKTKEDLKAFFASQIEAAEKRAWDEMSFGSPDWREFVKKIKQEERSRILSAVEKHHRSNTYEGEEQKIFHTTIDEVLAIIKEGKGLEE